MYKKCLALFIYFGVFIFQNLDLYESLIRTLSDGFRQRDQVRLTRVIRYSPRASDSSISADAASRGLDSTVDKSESEARARLCHLSTPALSVPRLLHGGTTIRTTSPHRNSIAQTSHRHFNLHSITIPKPPQSPQPIYRHGRLQYYSSTLTLRQPVMSSSTRPQPKHNKSTTYPCPFPLPSAASYTPPPPNVTVTLSHPPSTHHENAPIKKPFMIEID